MRRYLGFIILIIILLILLLWLYFRCHRNCETRVARHWINWNLSFPPTYDKGHSGDVVAAYTDYLKNYVDSIDSSAVLSIEVKTCPCDSSLFNIDASLVMGSGNIITPPQTKPKPGPSGDYFLANNIQMSVPFPDPNNGRKFNNMQSDTTLVFYASPTLTGTRQPIKKLAVIDTGLDTVYFNKAYPLAVWKNNLLWEDIGRPTLFNVVPGENENRLLDDNNELMHGTSATTIALTQISGLTHGQVPKIMSIKAFDKNESGTIYTVSCAMSYAIQNHADYINASWGYYGEPDSILRRYVQLASDHHIRVLAAAGNTPGKHGTDHCVNIVNDQNSLNRLLTVDSLFYPACWAPEIDNLVSVTQLNNLGTPNNPPIIPCYYQNYSDKYVTVGAMDLTPLAGNNFCCGFSIPFLKTGVEGSSFATPAVTGILMARGIDPLTNIKELIKTLPDHTIPHYTVAGSYFPFTPRQ